MVKITRFTLPERKNPIFKNIKEFNIQKSLGSGGFSVVFEGVHKKTNKKYAIKIIDFDRLGTLDQENIQKEIEAHKNFNHPYIIKLFDFFQEDKKVYLILELCKGGNLFDHLSKITKLQEIHIQKIIKQTLMALDHIHEKGYVMRDIKPENLLIDSQNNIKLCDFGWTASLTEDDEYRKTKAGTFAYMSPESLLGKLQDIRSDIWSIGILLYELFHLEEPYCGISCDNQLKLITSNPVKFDYNKISKNGIDLIRKILRYERSKRPGIKEILEAPFITQKLVFDPNFKNEKIKEDFLKDIGNNDFFDKKKMEAKKQKGIDEIMGKYNVNIKRNNSVNVISKKMTNNIHINLDNKEHKRDYSQNGKKSFGNNQYFSTKNIVEKTRNYSDFKNITSNLYDKKFGTEKDNDNIYNKNLYNKNITSFGSTKKIITNIKFKSKDFKQHNTYENKKFVLKGKNNNKKNLTIFQNQNVKKYKDEKKYLKKYKTNEIKKIKEIKLIEFNKNDNHTNLYEKKKFRNSKSLPMKHKSSLNYKINNSKHYKNENKKEVKIYTNKKEIKLYSNLEKNNSILEKKYEVNIYPSPKQISKLKHKLNTEPTKKFIKKFSLTKNGISDFNNNLLNSNSKNTYIHKNTKSSSFLNNYQIEKKSLNKNYSKIKLDINSGSKKKIQGFKNDKLNNIESINIYETSKKKNPPVKLRTSKLKSKKKIHIDFFKK